MAYSLSFGWGFWDDMEKAIDTYAQNNPDEWVEMCRDVFHCSPDFVDSGMVVSQIEKVDTCTDLFSPVEVWIDEEGYYTVLVD